MTRLSPPARGSPPLPAVPGRTLLDQPGAASPAVRRAGVGSRCSTMSRDARSLSLPPCGGGSARGEQAPPFRNPPPRPGHRGRLRRIPSGLGATPGVQGRRTHPLGRSPFLRAASPLPFCASGGGLGWGERRAGGREVLFLLVRSQHVRPSL